MKKRNVLYVIFGVSVLVALSITPNIRNDIRNLSRYGWNEWPTHEPPSASCPWQKKVFEKAGIVTFVGTCTDKRAFDPTTGYAMTFTDTEAKVIGTWVTNTSYEFTIQVFRKNASQRPIDLVEEWYAKLTPDQQKACSIQNADEPLQYFHDGRLMWTEDPHPMTHKTRYKIDIKPELSQNIFENSEPGDRRYDYLCGHIVGTTFSGHPPYFEFDDRSPDKYIFVGSYGQEGPMIDLNSIRF